MSWEDVAHLGGIMFVLSIFASLLFVVTMIVGDVYDRHRERRADMKILQTATDARKDFESTPYFPIQDSRKVNHDLPQQR